MFSVADMSKIKKKAPAILFKDSLELFEDFRVVT
jgi:hypothetical protein